MEPQTNSEHSNDKQIAWADVTNASSAAEANRVHRERVTDTIEVALTNTDIVDLARQNAADDDERTIHQATLDRLKGDIKETKSTIDAIDARIKDRHRTVRRNSQARKAEWIVETTFATNTITYIDPETGVTVLTRAMQDSERQLELTADTLLGKIKADDAPASANGAAIDDPEALLRAAEEGEANVVLPGGDDVEPEDESLDSEDDGDDS